MDYSLKEFSKDWLKESFSSYVLGVDIGGTNTNLAIAGIRDSTPMLLFSLNYKTKELPSLVPAVQEIETYAMNKHDISLNYACIGAAGVVSSSNESANLTNVAWDVSALELIKNTSLEEVHLINDFQAIGYGINLLDINNKYDFYPVRLGSQNKESSEEPKIIIGAGTGLGKAILFYDTQYQAYIPFPSEGGHADFPIHHKDEMELADFLKHSHHISQPLSYEDVLSGKGLTGIYSFLRNLKHFDDTEYTKQIDDSLDKAPLISRFKDLDDTCKQTFRLFTRFFARCAKNYALDTLARGGVYLAGGIAEKNKEIFASKHFFDEFENAYQRSDFLKKLPIHVIINYDVSLYGTCFAAMLKFKC